MNIHIPPSLLSLPPTPTETPTPLGYHTGTQAERPALSSSFPLVTYFTRHTASIPYSRQPPLPPVGLQIALSVTLGFLLNASHMSCPFICVCYVCVYTDPERDVLIPHPDFSASLEDRHCIAYSFYRRWTGRTSRQINIE